MLAKLARLLALAVFLAQFAIPNPSAAKPVVEVGFVLDTTGSMGPLIEGAKRKIWSIATAIVCYFVFVRWLRIPLPVVPFAS